MTSHPTFAGRGQELLRLTGYLEHALAGRGQVCFITGAPGRGKTTLAVEFARLAQAARADLVFAAGACDFMTGRGHPYHPFRAILQALTGAGPLHTLQRGQTARLRRVTEHATAYMLDWGRELFDIFLPPAHPGKTELDLRDASTREMLPLALLFQQYTHVLHRLADKTPLLLLVDDVQWADRSSLDLLLHLAQRLAASRILLLITLPNVTATETQQRLSQMLATARQDQGDAIIDLEQSDGRAWVDAYLDSMPNRLDASVRQALHRQTDGNPLAVSQLVQIMRDDGLLAQDEYGAWVTTGAIPWSQLPGHVEAVVQAVLQRLPPDVQRTLQVASVQGPTFAAEAVAQALGVETTVILEHLAHELVQRHGLIEPIRRARINGRKLAHFAFTHPLWTQRLQASLTPAERPHWHASTAQALTALYGPEAHTFEGALATTWHLVRGGLARQAQSGLRRLGEQAMAWSALPEAATYLTDAMAVGAVTAEETVPLLLARETVYRCQGDAAAQQADLATLEQLALEIEDPVCQVDILLRQAQAACESDEAPKGLEAAVAALELIQTAIEGGDRPREAQALRWQGEALLRQGDYPAATAALEAALAVSREAGLARLEADILRTLGACQAQTGHYEESRASYEQALRLCHQIGYRTGEAACRHGRGIVLLQQGRIDLALDAYGKTLAFCRRIGDQVGEAYALLNMAAQHAALGRDTAAATAAANALTIGRQIDAPELVANALVTLSFARRRLQEEPDNVVNDAQAALDIARSLGDWRIERAALLALADGWTWAGKHVKAQEIYWQAVDAARSGREDRELTLFALSGLVELALAGNAAELAAAHAAEIRRLLAAQPVATLDTLARPVLAAYRALLDRDPDGASALLAEGYQQLLASSERILDTALRESYLHDIAHHRALTAAVLARAAAAAPQPSAAAVPLDDPDLTPALASPQEAVPAKDDSSPSQPAGERQPPWWRRPRQRLRWWPAPALLVLALLLALLLQAGSAAQAPLLKQAARTQTGALESATHAGTLHTINER